MSGTVPVANALSDIYPSASLATEGPRWNHLLAEFESIYGRPASFIARSPGRVNIIGEHIDYSLYSVLPMAITADAILAVATTPLQPDDTHFRIRIANVQGDKFAASDMSFPLEGDIFIDATKFVWTNYFQSGLRGALELLRKKHGHGLRPCNMDLLMDGTVPVGGGLSSSAAIVSTSSLAVMVANGEESVDKTELTELAIVSERAVGVNSGGMDQAASVFSEHGSALFVSFSPSLTARPVKFPPTNPELCFVIVQSFVTSNKQVTGPIHYNLRVVECSMAAAYLNAVLNPPGTQLPADAGPLGVSLNGFHDTYFYHQNTSDYAAAKSVSKEEELKKLIELTKATLTQEEGYTREEVAKVLNITVDQLGERFMSRLSVRADRFKLRQRALHVFSEALRVLEFLTLLERPILTGASDTSAYNQQLGDLLNATQDSCRDLYECSCPELDSICAISRKAGAYGARVTGAGWGGCSVHLVPVDKVAAVKEALEREYFSGLELSAEEKEHAVVFRSLVHARSPQALDWIPFPKQRRPGPSIGPSRLGPWNPLALHHEMPSPKMASILDRFGIAGPGPLFALAWTSAARNWHWTSVVAHARTHSPHLDPFPSSFIHPIITHSSPTTSSAFTVVPVVSHNRLDSYGFLSRTPALVEIPSRQRARRMQVLLQPHATSRAGDAETTVSFITRTLSPVTVPTKPNHQGSGALVACTCSPLRTTTAHAAAVSVDAPGGFPPVSLPRSVLSRHVPLSPTTSAITDPCCGLSFGNPIPKTKSFASCLACWSGPVVFASGAFSASVSLALPRPRPSLSPLPKPSVVRSLSRPPPLASNPLVSLCSFFFLILFRPALSNILSATETAICLLGRDALATTDLGSFLGSTKTPISNPLPTMAPDSWAEADDLPENPSQSHQDHLDRQLLRHLMRRYGRDGVNQLMNEVNRNGSPPLHDQESIISSSTYSSVKSEDAPSIFDSASIRTFSDASSVTGSIISNVSARTAKFLSRKSQPGSSSTTKQSTETDENVATSGDSGAGASNAPKQKGAFTCGFCKEEDIQKTCTRKNDLKRHIEDFHNMNAQWFCRHRGCRMVFDWQTAYKTHLKQAHGGSRMSLDEAKANLCPQTVFACGFENCLQVFEAPSDDDADSTFKEYVSHVVKHFDEGAVSGEWSYSARMRNLLKQSGVVRAWTNSAWPEADRNRLRWHPQSSGILRKRLETRHLGDLQLLVQYAIALGSEPSTVHKYREDFVIPFKNECRQSIHGHKSRPQLPPAPATPESDPFQFRISRGQDPGLAAYLASQRRVYVPRPGPVRAGRSARPPMRTLNASTPASNPMAPQYRYSNAPTSPIYDPQQQQHYAMMSQPNGGIIAEDLRSLRSMASSVSEQDVEMGDAQMTDPGYIPQQFSGPYGPAGIPSPAPDGSCLTPTTAMEQQMPFAAYDSAHAY
ncbi:hypothetical protein G7046_g3354 [Stylonectria norvegica]|nr:hypothetical protein G7046_g3354 [Stylonectria norvegica]